MPPELILFRRVPTFVVTIFHFSFVGFFFFFFFFF